MGTTLWGQTVSGLALQGQVLCVGGRRYEGRWQMPWSGAVDVGSRIVGAVRRTGALGGIAGVTRRKGFALRPFWLVPWSSIGDTP